ncbi:MAG: RcpC/CpaB family pilus assembly protein [Anaerolineales bacterium]|jgi:hypothetical protein
MFGRRNLWIPIVLAVGTVFLVVLLLNGVIRPVTVVVAKVAIAPGTQLTSALVDIRSVPAQAKPADAYGQASEVIGKIVAVGRAPGDFITSSVLGDQAQAGLPQELPAGHIAVAVHVDMASGVAGLLRPGQTVTVIGILSPDALGNLQTTQTVSVSPISLGPSAGPGPGGGPAIGQAPASGLNAATPTPQPTPTPEPPEAPLARIAIEGLKVIMVPQSFRYEELPAGSSQDQLFASARTTLASQQSSVVVLDVPAAPVQLLPGLEVNPPSLLAALDKYGTIVLALEPASGLKGGQVLTLNLADLYNAMNDSR